MRMLLPVVCSLALAALTACAANPTPYPANESPGLPDGSGGGPTEPVDLADGETACAASDGIWNADTGLCELEVESEYDEAFDGAPAGALEPSRHYAGEGGPVAHVVAVDVTGEVGAWQLAVTIESPDTGCEQYADWWEVITLTGELVHRKLLATPHLDQPFTNDDGPLDLAAETPLIVRAHLYPSGYGGDAAVGTLAAGFAPTQLPHGFAGLLAELEPLPHACK